MTFDLFDSPELLDIQRTGFYRFLNQGIPQLLAKEFPIKVKNGNYSIELLLNEQDIKLITPEYDPRDCILKMKTYSCKLYARVQIVCKNASSKIVYQSLPEWVFLGQLPMMTKRGHFIINGSPRVIVHQVVRAPGIYFQKLNKKDDQNRARFYGDIIPLKGVWVRLQMTKKGRIEAKFKKGKKVEAEFLQKCLQVIENQSCSSLNSSDTPLDLIISKVLGSKAHFPEGSIRFLEKSAVKEKRNERLRLFPMRVRALQISPPPLPSLCAYAQSPCLRASSCSFFPPLAPSGLPQKVFAMPFTFAPLTPGALQIGDLYSLRTLGARARTCKGDRHGILALGVKMQVRRFVSKAKVQNKELLYDDYSKLLEKRKSRAESKSEHDAFVHTYDKLYRTTQDKELEEWQKKKRNLNFFKGSYKTSPTRKSKGFHRDHNIAFTKGVVFGAKSFANQRFARQLLSMPCFAVSKRGFAGTRTSHAKRSIESVDALNNRGTPCAFLRLYRAASLLVCRANGGNCLPCKKHSFVVLLKQNNFAPLTPRANFIAFTFTPHTCTPLGCKGDASALRTLAPQRGVKVKASRLALGASVRSAYKSSIYKVGGASGGLACRACQSPCKGCKGGLKTRTARTKFVTKWYKGTARHELTSFSSQENAFKQKKCSENLFATFKIKSRYDLGLLGREKINTKFGCRSYKGCNTQLTALDICSGSLWLHKLRKGEENIDDIDHSQNRRVRTSGELLQTQFENGVDRLKTLLATKLQERRVGNWNLSTFSSTSRVSCKNRYNLKFSFNPSTKRGSAYSEMVPYFKDLSNNLNFRTSALQIKDWRHLYNSYKSSRRIFTLPLLAPSCRVVPQREKQLQSKCEDLHKGVRQCARRTCKVVPKELCKGQGRGVRTKNSTKETSFTFDASKIRKTIGSKKVVTPRGEKEDSYKLSAKELFSTKPITGALREFFGSNPLSQYMDQTNPLAEITHKRRISSLGIGGISRESAGMAIRGIHPTHYGRICPIETPEGKNAGLVNSLAFYTKVDVDGFLKTPYYRVFKGQIQSSLGFSFCSAKEESVTGLQIAPSDLQKSPNNVLRTRFSTPESVPVRVADNLLDVFKKENPYKVQLMAISPIQMISVATSLIPFLEHNDANRALMGSNMQRQAVPLMISERPIVGTGLESNIIVESGHITESQISGFASHITANEVVIDTLEKDLQDRTFYSACKKETRFLRGVSAVRARKLCVAKPLNTNPLSALKSGVFESQGSPRVFVRKGCNRGKYLCAPTCVPCFAKHDIAQRTGNEALRSKPKKSSNLLNCTKKKQSFLRSSAHSLTTFSRSNQNTCITERPLIREFDWVQKGDVISDCSASNNGELAVGKNVLVAYIPWEGYNFEDAIVISERLVKEHVYTSLHIERYVFQAQDLKDGNEWFTKHLPGVEPGLIQHLEESGLPKIGSFLKEGDILVGKIRYLNKKPSSPYERLLCDILGEKNFAARNKSLYVPKGVEARVIYHKVINTFDNDPENKVRLGSTNSVTGSQIIDLHKAAKTVHLFLGERRVIQVGDKISGRHGNKGVISTILPRQDMPYLPDGTPIDIILNPLGVPSRMNVGQVLESLLGLAALYLNQHFKIAAFDERYGVEASKSVVFLKLYQARLQSGQNWLFQVNFPGKTRLIDGRSGECFDQWVTVGKAYILKLIHMVSEKIHARSTGPYALITQQPLRGRSNKGGQRLGEMEVWALEGFGAAYTLQELLTKKSDDFFGRKQIVDSILPNPSSVVDVLKPNSRIDQSRPVLGHPEIFKVLLCELQALCLDLGVYVVTPESFQRSFLGVVH